MFMRALCLVAGLLSVLPAFGAAPAAAQGRPPVCNQLEGELVALTRPQRGPSTQARRLEDAIRKQTGALRQTEADAQRMGCFQRGGFFFQPARPPACQQFDAALAGMQRNLEMLQRQLASTTGGRYGYDQGADTDRERGRLLTELAVNGCGPQYARFMPGNNPRGRGFFGSLFGGYSDRYVTQNDAPDMGTYRTVCVRKCDGFFWPVSFSTIPGNFSADEAVCQASCPGGDVSLYAYKRPGGTLEQAVTPQGEPYTNLENAFLFRSKFVGDCGCPNFQMQTAAGPAKDRISLTLFPQNYKTAQAQVPMPERRPKPFDVGLFENPFSKTEPVALAAGTRDAPVRRDVRIVGPKYVYARSAAEADAAPDRKDEP
ncbi:MAG: DUF2865 domain-containing protein [Rhodobiaceae bacterium]|nr:DUF2865 domain-containing protein [Rhodobiaceae bacterium]MCC0057484.1 DUF2865 domain-containing protein [Rhodobiaceae bacterium]